MSEQPDLRQYIGSNSAIRRYLLPDTSRVTEDGRLSIGGCDVLQLAEQYGTPLFVYDEQHLRNRCHEALAAFGDGVAYGAKAFLCKAMARLVNEEGLILDVATGGEAYVALMAGVPPDRMVMHGNNKSDEEIGTALHAGIGRIVVDSFAELDRIERIGADLGGTPKVMIRVTPGVEAHTHEYVMTGQVDSKFGFGLASGAAMEAVRRAQASSAMELVGIHAHIGSQIFLLHSYGKAIELLAPFVKESGVDELCLGGGLGVPYVEGEEAPKLGDWANELKQACADNGITARITAEPGRAIAATAAVTLYRVGTIKEIPDVRTYVSVDGGMSDNPRPVLYGSGYEAFLPRLTLAERPRTVTVVGKHCESGDVLVRDARVPQELSVGDILCTPVTGAYGFSMGSNYNKVPRPAVVFVRGGDSRIVVRRETYEDLIRLDE
ncbi:MAG: diaminopimelate decarboxylase [Acidimicrobiia bacterium]|nr:diaminopimelate decarboxylase [Acidimicrobiia bacterium]MBV9040970.1 diaminopimelate decarboxylase [Acidimicrobiia bacterium]